MLFEFGGLFRKVWRVALVLGTFVIGASTLFVAPVSAATGINQQLNFQGRLLNAQGAIVPDGYYNVEFRIYQDGTGTAAGNPGGTLKWSEDWLNSGGSPVRVLNGYMSVQLGSINAFGNSIDWNQDTIWLSINIGNTSSCTITTDFTTDCGGDGEMLPMKRMSAVPYALNAARLGGLTAAGFIQNTTTVQTATNMAIDGTARADTSILTPLVDTNTATALNIGTTNATAINLNQNVTVAANKTLTLAGGTTASRPASPSEGTLWYDTDTKQLLVYANGKWQADRSTSTKIVAASNASQALKDSADYVATGTSDQTIINNALIAAAGGKVYLTEGAYTISGSISVPNNTTLAGAGAGTVITIPNGHNTSINAITNTTTGGNGTGIVIQDLKLDGNKTNQTSGTMHGLYINGAGSGSTVLGVTASHVTSTNWANNGFTIISSANSKFENNSASGDAYGFYTSAVTSSAFTGNVSSGNDTRGYSLNSSSYLTLTGNIAQNGSGSGFSLNAVTYSALSGNVSQSNSYGFVIGASSDHNTLTGNTAATNGVYGIYLNSTTNNTVTGNTVYNSGDSGTNNGIYLASSSSNTITSNGITDTSYTSNNYAINISDSGSSGNYLAGNTLGTGSTNDQGTGTIYGGQYKSTTAYLIQPAADVTIAAPSSTTNLLSSSIYLGYTGATNLIGNGTAGLNLLTSNQTTSGTGALWLGSGNSSASSATSGVVTLSSGTVSGTSSTSGGVTIQSGANAGTGASGNVGIWTGDAASGTSGNISIDTGVGSVSNGYINIGTTNASNIYLGKSGTTTTVQGALQLNDNVTVAANKTLTLAGGTTASRPASPTEGMLWYDTSTHEMLKWNGTKWISNGSDAYLVAASNSSQADKDAADYVATGSSDQTTIQSALDRADPASVVSGARKSGKVYLFAGTYTTNDVISIPNNTTLAGAGRGTLIKFANINGQTKNMITNSDTSTGTGVTVRDLQLDGNNSVNTSGTMRGIYFNGMGGSSGAGARQGANIISSWVNNFYTDGVYLASSPNSTIIGNNVQGNTGNGIYISSSNRSNITNNVSQGNGGSGIVLAGAISENVVANTFAVNATAGVYLNGTSNNNFIGSNSLFNNGGNATNNAIYFPASANADYNTFTSNSINDTSGTTSNYAINISDNTSNYNYFADNVFTSTAGTSTINDPSGTNSVFSNQPFAENGGKITNRTANDAAAFTFQKADGTNVLTVDTTNSKVLVSGTIDTTAATTLNIGTAMANAISIGSSGITTTIAGNTGVTLNATTGTTMVCRNTTGLLSTCDATYVAPTATNFIQNQNASQQTGNFRISGTGQADTSILTPLVDTATAVALNIGTTNATSVTLGKSAISTTLSSSTINVGTSGSTTSILGAAQTTSGNAGNSMVIQGSNGLNGNGGTVTIQGGNANGTGTLGGNLTLAGGTGSTSNGTVILATSTFQTVTNDTGCFVGGTEVATSCTISSTAINNNASVLVGFSADGLIATMPDPSITTAGRVVYVTASGATKDFTLRANTGEGTGIEQNIAMRKNTTATMIWNGGNWTAAGASSSTTLQAAYDNTLQSAGGAELVVSKTTATNGLTIRDATGANAVNGTLLSIQTSSAANLLTVNSNVTEYTSNSGAETYSGTTTAFPASTWTALTGATVTRNITTSNIATGQGSAQVVTSTTAGSGVKNVLNTSLTASQHYNVSFSAKLSSGTFTDMAVYYSVDGSTDSVTCTTGQAINTSVWTKVNCTFTAPSSGITSSNSINIRQAGSGTAHTFYVDNISVTIAADYNYATDPGADDTVNFSTNWTAAGTATVTQNLSDGNDASSSAQASTSTANSGVRNKLSINPLASTLYRVSVYAKLSSGTALSDFRIRYTPNGGTNYVDCVDYNKQTVTSSWTQITCYINTSTTTVSNPYVYFLQTTASGTRVILVDTFSMTLASNATPNVQIGSGSNGGPTTLFTLDKGASAPIAANNDALLGSMYYDTTLGKLQCYEADGWGACGSSPDNIVTISPEYTNAVMHGTGVGTMVSDFCSDTLNINDPTNAPAICGANETYNFYKWTSPQPTPQTYSIYVTYQLPTTFKSFASGQTSLMGKTDSANSSVAYQIYRNNSSTGLTPCGSNVSVSTGVQSAWITQVASGAADPSTCSFTPGDSIVFKISVTASNNANAYVGNLGFTYSNK